ncbi:Protein of unknown function (DUF2911) [Mucilaginibacter frigoritolerans]|uniref:DUF2911 family protein n=1 Tax=Mucilaginibacter frigoritolerans TaxID=652788 RepID=A0A562U6T5_9SPHI|nr:DUF2911 domain-containing protein [Mucilaginibacter frigoritolerans]TWJ01530.1 Protein of unknown function (DUF2911) [Mucilaginibacter frigoritolerans]
MKKLFLLKAFALVAFAFLVSSVATAQNMAKKPASPRDSVSGTISGASVKISYGSPSVRGRKIWGGLVPYDKVWRLGANQMTTFESNQDLKIEGKTLPAGKYSVFATPGEKEWTIIFNSVTNQWGIKNGGSANDDPSKDVLKVTVSSMKSKEFTEALTFKIDSKGFVILWENLAVPVKVK